jgi:hypothetical protein
MPATVHNDSGIAVVVLSGENSLDAVYDAVDAALAQFPTTPAIGLIFDIVASQSVERRSPPQMHMMAEYLALQAERFGHRTAAVVESEIARGLMREAATFAGLRGVKSELFATYPDAVRWLREGKRSAARSAASSSQMRTL